MSLRPSSPLRRAAASSAVVRGFQRLAGGSRLCAALAAVAHRLRRMLMRLGTAPFDDERAREAERWTDREFAALVAHSRIVAALSAWRDRPLAALPDAMATKLMAPILQGDLRARVRTIGSALVFAVLTNAFWLTASGVSGHAAGWSVRIAILLAGVFAVSRPDALAAAIVARRDR